MAYGELRQAISLYIQEALTVYGPYFTDEAFSEPEQPHLPPQCRLAVRLLQLLEAEAGHDIQALKPLISETVAAWQPASEAIIRYLRLATERW